MMVISCRSIFNTFIVPQPVQCVIHKFLSEKANALPEPKTKIFVFEKSDSYSLIFSQLSDVPTNYIFLFILRNALLCSDDIIIGKQTLVVHVVLKTKCNFACSIYSAENSVWFHFRREIFADNFDPVKNEIRRTSEWQI